MHCHLEIVMPQTSDIEAAVGRIMEPFDENRTDEGDGGRGHAFWDYWTIGGRWAGQKLMAGLDQEKLAQFERWMQDEKVTVSGLRFGKDELSPASQIAKVDARWNETFPSLGGSSRCPMFQHSNDQHAEGLGGTIQGDVQRLSDVAARLECSHVVVAFPSYGRKLLYDGPLKAAWMIQESAWNGLNHVRSEWDGTLSQAVAKYRESLSTRAVPEYLAVATPRDDWTVVTVDYHS